MAEAQGTRSRPTDPVGRVLYDLSLWMAVAGGAVACGMALLTTVSVFGRYFFNLPVQGDFEIVAILTGVCAFLFLPYCQMTRGNVIVDFFLMRAPERVRSAFDTLGCLLYVVIAAILAWRSWLGFEDFRRSQETTMILEVPRWWTVPLAVACFALLVAVSAYTLVRSYRETRGDGESS